MNRGIQNITKGLLGQDFIELNTQFQQICKNLDGLVLGRKAFIGIR